MRSHPVRVAVLRGLAVLMPPLLTLLVFIWIWGTIESYLLEPAEGLARHIIIDRIKDMPEAIPPKATVGELDGLKTFSYRGDGDDEKFYFQLKSGSWIPKNVFLHVKQNASDDLNLEIATGQDVYQRFVNDKYLKRIFVIPGFLLLFATVLYFFGKYMAAGVGGIFIKFFEQLIHRLPIIRTVYSAAKQVTDFVFKEQEVEFTRVVAVEYPRKGIWSMGFVTGEGFLDVRSAVNEPVLSVLMPTSPMPATGFTITVPKSETIDLDITVDQAIQFCVSCGVVIPPHQQYTKSDLGPVLAAQVSAGGNGSALSSAPPTLPTSASDDTEGDD